MEAWGWRQRAPFFHLGCRARFPSLPFPPPLPSDAFSPSSSMIPSHSLPSSQHGISRVSTPCSFKLASIWGSNIQPMQLVRRRRGKGRMREIGGKDELVADGERVPGSPLGNLLGSAISNISLLFLLCEFSQKAKD